MTNRALYRRGATAVVLGAASLFLAGAAAPEASATLGPQGEFAGCGSRLTYTGWDGLNVRRFSTCTFIENLTRGWQRPPPGSTAPPAPRLGKGIALRGASISASGGAPYWVPGSGDRQRNCTSRACIGGGTFSTSPGTPFVFRSDQWAGSGGVRSRGAQTGNVTATTKYRYATAAELGGSATYLQKRVKALSGNRSPMRITARSRSAAVADCSGLRYLQCAVRSTSGGDNRVDRVRVTNKLVTVRFRNNVNQRLNLSAKNFGKWARDTRAEYREGTYLPNGEKNTSNSMAPFVGISGQAQWGASRPVNVTSSATFEYTYVDTTTEGGQRNTAFTGNTVVLTVNLDASGNNSESNPSTCVVFTPQNQSRAFCEGTASDGSVQVLKSGADRYITVVLSPN